jgi:hypothetical protein
MKNEVRKFKELLENARFMAHGQTPAQTEPKSVDPKTEQKKQQEFERDVKQWDKWFKEHEGKIPREFPRSIFDRVDDKE